MSLTKQERFLRELTKLSEKHGMYIGGCGCMGSPFVSDARGRVILTSLEFSEYSWGYHAQNNSDKKRIH